jgi:cytochrome d ubiquinol oxidase subunit II
MILPYIAAGTLWLSIIVYAALGGADFGGGVWGILNFGRRKLDQNKLIVGAIGPVWEANNVWLIYLIVGLNTCFPFVAATLSISLFIPFSLVLIGVVMRGASFGFRTHFSEAGKISSVWGNSFSVASLITRFALASLAHSLRNHRWLYGTQRLCDTGGGLPDS